MLLLFKASIHCIKSRCFLKEQSCRFSYINLRGQLWHHREVEVLHFEFRRLECWVECLGYCHWLISIEKEFVENPKEDVYLFQCSLWILILCDRVKWYHMLYPFVREYCHSKLVTPWESKYCQLYMTHIICLRINQHFNKIRLRLLNSYSFIIFN